jgi:hypothetical protein
MSPPTHRLHPDLAFAITVVGALLLLAGLLLAIHL